MRPSSIHQPAASVLARCLLASVLLTTTLTALACRAKEEAKAPAATPPPAEAAAEPAPATPPEEPLAPIANPPGAIPATQALVHYRSAAGGYELDVPAGWVRHEDGPGVTLIGGPDGLGVAIQPAPVAPNLKKTRHHYARALVARGRAVEILSVEKVMLPSGPAMLIRYGSNSDPDPATRQQVRRANETYLFWKDGQLAGLTLWAPQGADTKQAWARVAKSFRWS